MKRYLKSGFNTIQDVKLDAGTYTLVLYVKSMYSNVYTFALGYEIDGSPKDVIWTEYDIDVVQGELCKVWLTFTIDKKATKFKPIANNFSESLPVYVADLQLTRGNIPVEAGASPFDIDQILNDLHDEIDAIEDFTEGAFKDGLLNDVEKTQLRASLDSIGAIVESVKGSYDKLKVNPFISQDRMADINRTYNDFMVAWVNIYFDPENPIVEDSEGNRINMGGLKDIILWIVDGDHIVDENERAEKDRALEAFNSALYAYNLAEKEVYKDIGDEIEDVQNEINSLEDFTNKAFEDGIIDRAEAKAIEKYINTVNESFETIEASYNELMRNDLLLTVGKNTLEGWYNALLSAKDSLMDTILIAIEDGIATPAEKEAVDDAFIVYNNAMKEYQVAFEVAREAIEKERLKDVQQEIDEAKQSVTDLGEEIDNAFSDSSITNIEANSLDLMRKNLAKEVTDVIAIATSISVSVVDVNAKMSTLNTEINKYVGKDKYPITVTVANRNSINTAFANLEASLVALYDAIEDKKVQSLEDYMEGAFQDGVLDEGEKQKIRAYLQSIEETMGRAESQYAKVFGDTLLIGDAKTNLFNAKVNLWGRRENLVNAINTALDSTKLTQAQIDNVNKYLNGWSGNPSFNAIMKSFQDAIEEARKSIDEQRIKSTIVKVDVEYALGDSMTEAPTTGWKTIADPWQKNRYMWSRIATYYKGNPETPVYSDETCIAGARGIGVESITERYYHSTSATELLGGAWSNDAPTPLLNMYIWTRSLIKYTDASVPDKYTDPIMVSGFSGKTISISASATSFRTSKEGIETPSEIIVKAFASNTTITSWLYSVNGGEFKTTNKPHKVTGSGNTRTIPKSTEFDTLSIMVTDGTLDDVITINRVSDAIKVTETIDYYGISNKETVEPTVWHKNTIPTKTPEQYLWNYEWVKYSNGNVYETQRHIIQGKDPRSIESIKNQYIYSTSDTTPPSETAGWKDTIASLGTRPANSFLWIRDYIAYSYGDDSVTEGRLVKEGDDGEDGITISQNQQGYTYRADLNGDIIGSLANGMVELTITSGSTPITCSSSTSGGTPTTNGTYRVTRTLGNGITTNQSLSDGKYRITPTKLDVDEATVKLEIKIMMGGAVTSYPLTLTYRKQFDGADGKSTEFIFKGSTSDTNAPTLPSTSQEDDWYGQGTSNLWNDDLVEPTKALPYVWASQRKKVDGVWGAFTPPKVWLRWAEDGDDAKSLILSASSLTMACYSTNVAKTGQTITINAKLQNVSGTASFDATPYNASGTALSKITLGGSGNTRTLTSSQWLSTFQKVVITATLSGLSDTVTITRLPDGDDGDGITSTTIEYAKSSNGTTPPSSGWGTSLPEPIQGWYLWTRTTTTYKVAETTVSYSVSHWAEDGDGITSTTIHYQKSSSGTAIPQSWLTSLPTPTKGMYLWTRTTTVYKKSPTTVAYSVSYWAEDGDKGDKGDKGEPPKILNGYPKTQYAIGTSKTIYPATGWGESIIDVTESKPYLWSRQEIKYDSGDTLYTGYLMLTNITPIPYMAGEWDMRVAYTRNDKSYPIVTYKKGTNNKPLYYYPKNEGVIEYIQFVKPDVNYSSTWYKQYDLVWYENDGSNGDPVCPLGIFRSKYNNNRYLPTTSSWWDNVTADYAPNGVEGQKLWEFADGMELIITDALMANFGKIASAVFSGDHMISQFGEDQQGNQTSSYKDFGKVDENENSLFTPNIDIDFFRGLLKAMDVDIRGTINATSGEIGDLAVESSGRIAMYMPNTTQSRLTFRATNIPALQSLLDTTVYGGGLTAGAGSLAIPQTSSTSTQTLTGSTYISQTGSTIEITGGRLLNLTCDFQGVGNASVGATLYLMRGSVKVHTLASAFVMGSGIQNDVGVVNNITLEGMSSGTYTLMLEVSKVGTQLTAGNATVGSGVKVEWSFNREGVRNFLFGLNGFLSFFSNNHIYFTEENGLDVRGKTNMPGLLGSASVIDGQLSNEWGRITSIATYTGGYRVTMSGMTHANYTVQITSHTTNQWRIGTKTLSNFIILGTGNCDIAIMGNNY